MVLQGCAIAIHTFRWTLLRKQFSFKNRERVDLNVYQMESLDYQSEFSIILQNIHWSDEQLAELGQEAFADRAAKQNDKVRSDLEVTP